MPEKRSADLAMAQEEDAGRSLEEWRALGLPSLKLKCNQYSLVESGKKEDILMRLKRHFEPSSSEESDPEYPDDEDPDSDGHGIEQEEHGDDLLDLDYGDINEFEDDHGTVAVKN